MSMFQTPGTPQATRSHLAAAEQEILQVLEADWRNMCGLDDAPLAQSVDPAKLDIALPNAFVLQRMAPRVARTRVAGQRLHDLLKMDPRGMDFGIFFTESSRDTIASLVEAAFTTPSIIGIPLIAHRGIGRKSCRAEALLLPMRDARGDLTRMMGAIVVSGAVAGRSLRFEIAKDQTLRCDALAPGFVERRAHRGHNAPRPDRAPGGDASIPPRVMRQPNGAPRPVGKGFRPQLVIDNT